MIMEKSTMFFNHLVGTSKNIGLDQNVTSYTPL